MLMGLVSESRRLRTNQPERDAFRPRQGMVQLKKGDINPFETRTLRAA